MTEERFYEASIAGARRSAPAALRNREPIAAVLEQWLPERGVVLELASGTGEHAVYFAERFPKLEWQPSDLSEAALGSIDAWRAQSRMANVRKPVRIDAEASDWPVGIVDAILCINMAHISPWSATIGVLDGAARHLRPGGRLIFYGPWIQNSVETAQSNLLFDADLRRRNPAWGLRTVEALAADALTRGLELAEQRPMPANNLMLLARRTG